ncbi:hypothetical protein E2C01_055345 [Portunus trituberculatus]|uniref:CCHC-type domain-containing protein n=1 Tax=Portunus trituberculatus TaxID=210409 RepID=A0A5B7GUJ4_PORTR|nr:hypothetical protein [Portunus trituberculatus]
MVTVLARDHFIDALGDQQLQIYVRQVHETTVQGALSKALEFESFLQCTAKLAVQAPSAPRGSTRHLRVCCTQTRQSMPSPRRLARQFSGVCWGCGQKGHIRGHCKSTRQTRSLEELPVHTATPPPSPCCANCGQWGHTRGRCQLSQDLRQLGNDPGPGHSGWKPVDTGAERTFVQADVVRARHIPWAEQQLCGVTRHCVTLCGPVTVEIAIGEVVEQLPVYVADMEEPCLLGVDFLARCRASVDVTLTDVGDRSSNERPSDGMPTSRS